MRLLLLLFVFALTIFGYSQDFYPPLLNYTNKDYGADRNPENYAVVQDFRGVMYFGNSHGILEFDGENWDFIKVRVGEFVRSLAVDDFGRIYAGTFGDFGYLEASKNGELVYRSLLELLPEEDQFFGNIWRIFTHKNTVYFQAQECFYVFDIKKKTLKTIYPNSSYHLSFLVGEDLYLRERGVGLVKYNPSMEKPVRIIGTESFKEYGVFGIHQLQDDSLLIVTQEIGVYKFKNGGMRQLKDTNKKPLKTLGIFGSQELSDGNFLLTTLTEGVFTMNASGQILNKIDRSTGLKSDVVQAAYQDRDLNVWLAMGNGIAKVNYHSPLSYFNEKTGIEGNVEAVCRFKGELYVGTAYGLFAQAFDEFAGQKFYNTELINAQVWDLYKTENTLYIASSKGVYATEDGIAFEMVTRINANCILYDKAHQAFVVAGAYGIWIFDKEFNERWSYINNFSTFLGIEQDPNNDKLIWLGSLKDGMIKLTYQQDNEYEISTYSTDEGLLDGIGTPLKLGDELIFGAKDGLFYFESEEKIKQNLTAEELKNPENYKGFFRNYALHDSIFSGQFLLLEKGIERMWYCNEFKVGYFDKRENEFFNKPFWGIDYGRINTLYLEDNGVLWIGAVDGLIRFEENQTKRYQSDFYALVRNVYLGSDSTLFGGGFSAIDEEGRMLQSNQEILKVDYAYNDLRFVFAAPYFEDEHEPLYRYKLVGNDEEWSSWTYKSEANFTNLSEGAYEFRVEAKNIYGQLSKQTMYKFTVLPPWYRTTWAYFLYFMGFLLVLFIGVRISSMRLKAKNVWLEGVVEERTKEISDKNVVLEVQKKEIEDSINYAQRIQHAILPLEEEMQKWLPDSFVLFRPKDIVSGDFYWFIQRDQKLIIICADCTGHGVPGAFMSMIGSDRLNNIVSEKRIYSPAAILSELNRAIKSSLKQDGQKNSTKDGMDAAVCMVDLETKTLKYAGANRPLWLVHNAELTEIKATKVAVAGFTDDNQVYEEHEITLAEGMKFYMTTDGYADQFGGERDKKFKVKALKELLLANANEPFSAQRERLENALLTWMGKTDQVDDICVMGFEPKMDF
jgi:serine phosphatase RsbU (regulator of sigma subunit)